MNNFYSHGGILIVFYYYYNYDYDGIYISLRLLVCIFFSGCSFDVSYHYIVCRNDLSFLNNLVFNDVSGRIIKNRNKMRKDDCLGKVSGALCLIYIKFYLLNSIKFCLYFFDR